MSTNLPAYPAVTGSALQRMKNLSGTVDQADERIRVALDAAVQEFTATLARDDEAAATRQRITALGRRARRI